VKDPSRLSSLIEMNAVTCGDVKQIVGGEGAVECRVLMIAGDKTFLLAKSRRENALVSIVGAVGKKLQG